ncbi:MAG: hypothetical protein K0S08_99 [Gammaproteobacteria bacterium]|jgi:hypothetical protein|nr:hypothetical protein [Gammaproteobacteria bacterium]
MKKSFATVIDYQEKPSFQEVAAKVDDDDDDTWVHVDFANFENSDNIKETDTQSSYSEVEVLPDIQEILDDTEVEESANDSLPGKATDDVKDSKFNLMCFAHLGTGFFSRKQPITPGEGAVHQEVGLQLVKYLLF